MITTKTVEVSNQGLHEITHVIRQTLQQHVQTEQSTEGLCTIFIQHTSASLLIQENADPSARYDLEQWLNRLVPEHDPIYTHTIEGPDDMPAHIKSMLTATTLSIPYQNGKLMLGTWQGIYLWEHRVHRGTRRVIVHTST